MKKLPTLVGLEWDKFSKLSHTESHKTKKDLRWRASDSP